MTESTLSLDQFGAYRSVALSVWTGARQRPNNALEQAAATRMRLRHNGCKRLLLDAGR
jgi:hypothetical protein